LNGVNFKPDDKVFFDAGQYGGLKEALSKKFINEGQVTVVMPEYQGKDGKVGISISGKFGTQWASGPVHRVIAKPPSKKKDKGNEEPTKGG